tara:strand:- start:583 stop:903 length:321 start_codon:yes stop_codon:yes gene_type:complete
MKLTGKCEEDFEKWYYIEFDNRSLPYLQGFYVSDLSVQYGVYVDFFDSLGIYLSVDRLFFDGYEWFCCVVNKLFINTDNGLPINHLKTRQEARTASIEKANEIYNK